MLSHYQIHNGVYSITGTKKSKDYQVPTDKVIAQYCLPYCTLDIIKYAKMYISITSNCNNIGSYDVKQQPFLTVNRVYIYTCIRMSSNKYIL